MKKHFLIGASLLTLGITTTAIYAQVTGTSVVDKMKAVAHSFTLATTLNPSDSGLTSDPVKGKKSGDILTAGEWNRVLELMGEGGGGGGTGWVDVPLTDTSDFDISCEYRFQMSSPFIDGNWSFGSPTPAGSHYYYATYVANNMIAASSTYNVMHGIPKATKNRVFLYWLHGTGIDSWATTKIEKLCGGGGATGGGISNVEVVTSQDVGAAVGTSYANRWSEANCPAGKKIISGGCSYPNTRNSFIHNAPKSDLSGWTCGGIAYNGDISSTSAEYPTRPTSYAVCGVYGGGSTPVTTSVYTKCTNAQSLDSANIPCYSASRNTGAGTDQYRVASCIVDDGVRTYTAASILNFNNLVANKWAISVNGGTLQCVDGSILVAKIQ